MRRLLVCGLLASGAGDAFAVEGTLSLGTGMRPFGLGGPGSLLGGGLRAGIVDGNGTLFVGGSLSSVTVTTADVNGGNDQLTVPVMWSTVSGGIRIGVGERAVDPYGVAGVLIANGHISTKYAEYDEKDTVFVHTSFGGFAGGGADVALAERVDLGVEAGLAGVRFRAGSGYVEGGDSETDDSPGQVWWGYTDLHVVFHIGGGAP